MEDWVELFNNGSSLVDLSDWQLRDASDFHIYTFPTGVTLGAGEYLLLARDPGALAVVHPDLPAGLAVLGPYLFNFDGGGDQIRLYDETGLLQFSMAYDDDLPWPADADGNASGNVTGTISLMRPGRLVKTATRSASAMASSI